MEKFKLLKISIEAAISAGIEIINIYNSPEMGIEIKENNSPLTLADKNANDIIIDYLIPTGIPIISEENKQIDYETRKKWSSCWIVDPLDGTKEFIKRNGEFTVNIALVEKGIPELGVIYVPVTKVLYFSVEGKSFKITLDNTDMPYSEILKKAEQIVAMTTTTEPVKIVGSRSHLNEDTQNFIGNISSNKEVEIVSRGSSLKFCLVAEGTAHYYPRFAPTMEWDTAAGQAICTGAGAQVINQETQKPLLYNRENLLNPYFLVTI